MTNRIGLGTVYPSGCSLKAMSARLGDISVANTYVVDCYVECRETGCILSDSHAAIRQQQGK